MFWLRGKDHYDLTQVVWESSGIFVKSGAASICASSAPHKAFPGISEA